MTSNIIVVEKELLNSEVFRSLSGTAMVVYFDFLQRRRMKPVGRDKKRIILNNGAITYCYSEALKKGISRSRFARAITQLVEKGFLDIAHTGNGYGLDKSLYAISEWWKDWGTEYFVKKTRLKDKRRGRGFSPGSMANLKTSITDATYASRTNETYSKKTNLARKVSNK